MVVNVVLLLILTLIIACLTLVERKILSLMQRRIGPDFVGYRGRLQYIADALKLFIKGALIPDEANKFWFICIPALTLTVCYSFWLNAVWGPSIAIFEVEYNLIYSSLFSALFTFCIILTGFFSRNKYSLLASIRAGLGMLNLELFLGLFFLNLIILGESFSILTYVTLQEIYWLGIPLVVSIGLIAITFLLEVNRTPFDLSEAESELVAGYTTEYGGFLFGVYYLGEYLHLFFFSLLLSSLIFGGWELPRFLLILLYDYIELPIMNWSALDEMYITFLSYEVSQQYLEVLLFIYTNSCRLINTVTNTFCNFEVNYFVEHLKWVFITFIFDFYSNYCNSVLWWSEFYCWKVSNFFFFTNLWLHETVWDLPNYICISYGM